nr:unnamed protein product [Callosobruchus analis]
MEYHCVGGDVLCFVEVDQDTNNLLFNDIRHCPNDFEKWFSKADFIIPEEDSLSFETDPLLSEAQVFDKPTILEGFELLSQVKEETPKPRSNVVHHNSSIVKRTNKKPVVKRCKVANTNTATNEGNSIIDFTLSKNNILLSRVPAIVEISVDDNSAMLILKDENRQQMFLAQQMVLPANYTIKETTQKIVKSTLVPICKEIEHVLPQFLTNLGMKIHLCPLRCNKAFIHIADAKLHALEHMQIKPFKCNVPNCPWEFYTACKLRRHLETHQKNKNFVCDITGCNRTFSTIYNLNEHKKKHSLPADLPCTVSSCTSFFQNEKQRRKHFKSHDRTEAPYRCTNEPCSKGFFTKILLDTHMKACRESELTCKYPDCGKKFKNPYRLREHIRQHTGAKPYQCRYDNCTWRFSTAGKLRRHQSIHTNDRKFHCTIGDCTKSFLRSEHLKDHTLTHIERKGLDAEGKYDHLAKRRSNSGERVETQQIDLEEDFTQNSNSTADALLEQAIQSLGVPTDMVLNSALMSDAVGLISDASGLIPDSGVLISDSGLIPDVSIPLLDNESLSTVNLRDLE